MTQAARIPLRDLDYHCSGCQTYLCADEVEMVPVSERSILEKIGTGKKFHEIFEQYHRDHEGNPCGPVQQICFR